MHGYSKDNVALLGDVAKLTIQVGDDKLTLEGFSGPAPALSLLHIMELAKHWPSFDDEAHFMANAIAHFVRTTLGDEFEWSCHGKAGYFDAPPKPKRWRVIKEEVEGN